jgi:hypothetical protein
MKDNKKLMIWSDQCDEKWEEEYKAEHPEASDEEVMQAFADECSVSFDDEKLNLNIPIERNVLVIKTINRWDGQSICCSIISRRTIGDLLERFFDGNSFYVEVDTGDLVGEAYHHDGTNYYRFRELTADALHDDIDDLVYKIDVGEEYAADLARLTKSFGGRIAKVYGWEVQATDE